MPLPVLTRREKTIAAVVVASFCLGVMVKVYRERHPAPPHQSRAVELRSAGASPGTASHR